MSGDLASMDIALYSALTPLQCPAGGIVSDTQPFAVVDRWVGEITDDQIREACAQFPACFLRFDQEIGTRYVNTIGGGAEDYGTASWTILIAVEDPREVTDAMIGAVGVPGALSLIGLIYQTVDALLVTDSWRWRRLRFADTKPLLVKRGSLYVYGIRMEGYRYVEQTTPADMSVPITDIYGTIAEYGLDDPPGYEPVYPADVFAVDATAP